MQDNNRLVSSKCSSKRHSDVQKAALAAKIHIQAEGMGKPMQFALTEGQRSDVKGFGTLNSALKVKCTGRGRPKQRPRYLVGDKGYDAQKIRHTLRRQRTTPVIPKRKNAKRFPPLQPLDCTESATALNG